jgi:hypothetical protein
MLTEEEIEIFNPVMICWADTAKPTQTHAHDKDAAKVSHSAEGRGQSGHRCLDASMAAEPKNGSGAGDAKRRQPTPPPVAFFLSTRTRTTHRTNRHFVEHRPATCHGR